MAFFTRVNSNVPVLPPDDLGNDACLITVQAHTHRRYASEPVTTSGQSSYVANLTTEPSSISNEIYVSSSASKHSDTMLDQNASTVISASTDDDTVTPTNVNNMSANAKGRPIELSAPVSETDKDEIPESNEKNGEPKRYKYVVDRVLGVEV